MAPAARSRAVGGLSPGAAFAATVSSPRGARGDRGHLGGGRRARAEIDARLADLAELGGGGPPRRPRCGPRPAELQPAARRGPAQRPDRDDRRPRRARSGLDPAGVEALLARLERLRAEGNTIMR